MTEPTAPRHQPPWQIPPPPAVNVHKPWSQGKIAAVTVAACVAALGLLILASAIVPDSMPSSSSDADDVEITGCSLTSADNGRASLRVINSTNRVRDYRITVAFLAADGTQLATGRAFVSDLAPGQTAVDDAIGLLPRSRSDLARCRVTAVSRS